MEKTIIIIIAYISPLLPFFSFCAGIYLIYNYIPELRKVRIKKTWKRTNANVTDAQVIYQKKDSNRSNNLIISFSYQVDDKTLAVNKYDLGWHTKRHANKKLNKYKNRKIFIFYDPRKPEKVRLEQELEKGPQDFGFLVFLLGIFFAITGFMWSWGTYFN